MIKRIKHFDSNALINSEDFRKYAENFESEILRGISTLSILTIIKSHDQEGIYGYQLLQELRERTNDMLILEEGTLYPMLKKLQKDQIVFSQRKTYGGRPRNYYSMTPKGYDIFNHLSGFFSKLIEAIAPMMDIEVDLHEKQQSFMFCPNCANKISLEDIDFENPKSRFCTVCGYNITESIQELFGGKN